MDSKHTPPTSPHHSPSYMSHEEYQGRLEKLTQLRELGIEPYPHSFKEKQTTSELRRFVASEKVGDSEEALAGKGPSFRISGRLVLMRAMGKNLFGQIQDEEGRLQIMVSRDVTTLAGYDPSALEQESSQALPKPSKVIEKKLDLGDLVGLEGPLFFTQKGELTLLVQRCTLLSKSLLPLPDKHSGLADEEVRQRKRWLDLISEPASFARFRARSTILRTIRETLTQEDFLEVETPILQNIYGGANARPFVTHHNALKTDPFLRISLEIPLKKLLVGGYPRIFELGKVFRNEGIDRTHNPEFTMLELYAAGSDYHDMMTLAEKIFVACAAALSSKDFNPQKISFCNETIDLTKPFARRAMADTILDETGIDVAKDSLETMRSYLATKGGEAWREKAILKQKTRGELMLLLFEEFVEKTLIQPTHITDHPIESTPLCKRLRTEPGQELRQEESEEADRLLLIERFETFIAGKEFCNAYSELNDPIEQRALLEKQLDEKAAEKHPLDEEFLEAICQGMPPAGGLGIGIDRLCMLLTGSDSIREVLFFPTLRPAKSDRSSEEHSKENSKKSPLTPQEVL